MYRNAPSIGIKTQNGYAALLAHNFDTVQESFNFSIPSALAENLDLHKNLAIQRDSEIEYSFGGERFQMWIGGSQGKRWVLANDDFQIHIGSPKQQWPITVRYLAPGLWEHGYDALRKRIEDALWREGLPICEGADINRPETWSRLSRVDYAFDFYSPKFTSEMVEGNLRKYLLLPAKVKGKLHWEGPRDETLQIGHSKSGLIIQVYDKGREITDMSGKTWMYRVWEREGYYPPEDEIARDVWRLEVRFGKEFIKNRGCLTMDHVRDCLQEMLAEALMTRRMVRPNGDTHRERWPLHPLWAAAYEAAGQAGRYVPIGRQLTLRKDAMIDTLEKQITGTARALATLDGDYNDQIAKHKLEECAENITADPEHIAKVAKAKERYRYIEEAR